ncbi:hypothetical protein B0J18DRAFT_229761 [Chaetomium sp. MPI-SDFR-AT-0129]|nr:hypothetical protein B0J18DRAFT_229761 [Chaetomium sp. MPI-SDFR-AT-0129]
MGMIRRCGDEVREEIGLAQAQADFQDQELQKKEREAASGHRRKLGDLLSRTGHDLETIKGWQLQQEDKRRSERRRQLLDFLSSYDHLSPFKRACKERHCGTAQWIFHTTEFSRWQNGPSRWIWCSGKIGSGKTILTASAVTHLFACKSNSNEIVTFFFPQFNDPQSLCAETVVRSIIRQSLDPVTLSEEMEAKLAEIRHNPTAGIDELTVLLQQRLAQSERFFIFIDALDEFEPRERRALLDFIVSLGPAAGLGPKVFLAGRESLSGELQDKLPGIERISMASVEAKTDIAAYVKETLQERVDNRDLVVGDQSLISDIEEALTNHADGMFLWVTFLIDELCAQHCDADIRNAIGCLPSTLTETFSRALLRIISRRSASVAAKVFSWVAIAKRYLTLDEIREAISIEIGQLYSMPERLVNGIDQLPSWCENLVHVDEELKTVQFAHQAIHKFIIEGPTGPQFGGFRFNLQDADHHAGEICVTYLNFNDFKTTLTRRPQPIKPVDPVAMARLALSPRFKVPSTIPGFGLSSRHQKSKAEVDVVRVLSSYNGEDGEGSRRRLERSHPFLEYASTYWISHTSRFRKGSMTWDLWHRMITYGNDLVKRPWPEQQEFNALDPDLLAWSLQSRHYALIRLIEGCGGISEPNTRYSVWSLAGQGDIALLDVLLEVNLARRRC